MHKLQKLGIIGGTGELGSSLVTGFLNAGIIDPEDIWISNRSGQNDSLSQWPEINFTTNNQTLVDNVDAVILSVPPAMYANIKINAVDKLVVSVMAGVSSDQIAAQTNATRIIKAISNPAAHLGSAYSAYYCNSAVTAADRKIIDQLFSSCGMADEVSNEGHIDHFTALTGPVPGYVAFFADALSKYTQNQGISSQIADRAVRQLFIGSGKIFESSEKSPALYVKEMIEYQGTTAAGLEKMKSTSLAEDIQKGVAAAYQRTKTIS